MAAQSTETYPWAKEGDPEKRASEITDPIQQDETMSPQGVSAGSASDVSI